MNAIAWILFILGTLLATATGAHDPPMWVPFGGGITLAVVGAMLLRRQRAASAGSSDSDAGIRDLPSLRAALHEVTAQTAALAALPPGAPSLREKLDALLLDNLLPVVDARGFLVNTHGVEAYAKVFTPLASGERCLNRAWSALADGVPHEATAQLSRAQQHLEAAEKGWPEAS
jgi:hypothetical protein